MRRIAILTAGGDTPALNATIHGAVTRANQLKIEIFGIIKGFNGVLNPNLPHVHLNPLFQEIPEIDPAKGGTLIGSSRDYVDASETAPSGVQNSPHHGAIVRHPGTTTPSPEVPRTPSRSQSIT